jgi:hypothetical protein
MKHLHAGVMVEGKLLSMHRINPPERPDWVVGFGQHCAGMTLATRAPDLRSVHLSITHQSHTCSVIHGGHMSQHVQRRPAEASGSLTLGGDLSVYRLGFGAMRITGPGIWGAPADHDGAIAVLRKALDLGVNLIDTADSYGPDVSEQLIAEALYPYPAQLVIATKGGLSICAPHSMAASSACGGSASTSTSSIVPIRACHSRTPWARWRRYRKQARYDISASPTSPWTSWSAPSASRRL